MQNNSAINNLEQELKQLIIEALKLEDVSSADIASDEPLFGEGLGLDSIDALELGVMLRKRFGITIAAVTPEVKSHFDNIHSLALFVLEQREVKS